MANKHWIDHDVTDPESGKGAYYALFSEHCDEVIALQNKLEDANISAGRLIAKERERADLLESQVIALSSRLDESEKKREQLRNDMVDLVSKASREAAAEFMRQRDEALSRLDQIRSALERRASVWIHDDEHGAGMVSLAKDLLEEHFERVVERRDLNRGIRSGKSPESE